MDRWEAKGLSQIFDCQPFSQPKVQSRKAKPKDEKCNFQLVRVLRVSGQASTTQRDVAMIIHQRELGREEIILLDLVHKFIRVNQLRRLTYADRDLWVDTHPVGTIMEHALEDQTSAMFGGKTPGLQRDLHPVLA
jgi:hypothetical protein